MQKFKKIAYLILIIIILVLSFTLYTNATKENDNDIKEKTLAEIKYVENKLVGMFNNLNNIEFDNYKLSIGMMGTSDSKSTENNSNTNSKQSSESDVSDQENSSNSSSEKSSSDSSGTSVSENKKYSLEQNSILTSKNNTIDWNKMKFNIELLYSTIPTVTIDLYELNVNQNDILNFNTQLDNTLIAIKEENKNKALLELAKLYTYIPTFIKSCSDDEIEMEIINIKSDIFDAYSVLDGGDWERISKSIQSGIDKYSKLLTNASISSKNQYSINKGYIIINEIKNAVNIKDKEVFLIKYKNLLEELSNI